MLAYAQVPCYLLTDFVSLRHGSIITVLFFDLTTFLFDKLIGPYLNVLL